MTYEIKPKAYYEVNKAKFNESSNMNITKKYRGAEYVGFCTFLCREKRPTSYQNFLDEYVKSSEGNNFNPETLTGDKYKGRSIEQLTLIAERIHKELNNNKITLEECLHDLINHVIIETYDGMKPEDYVIDLINKTGKYIACAVTGEFDRSYGVDIMVKDLNGELICLIQIKPKSTFASDKNWSLISDRKFFFTKEENLNKYLKTIGKENITLDYMIYDKSEYEKSGKIMFLKRKNGKYRFKLNELLHHNGKMKISLFDDEVGTFQEIEF